MPNHSHLNQLGAGESYYGRSFPLEGHSQNRPTTSLMQELSAKDFSPDEELDTEEEDMADDGEDGEEEQMKQLESEGSPLRSIE